jgi:hypothetical protein
VSCSQEQLHRVAVIVHFQAENRPGLGKGVSACLCFRRKGKD